MFGRLVFSSAPQARNPSSAGAASILASCPADSVAKLTENMYSDNKKPVSRLPQCIIIGVIKGGTDALMQFLGLHPDVRIADNVKYFTNLYSRGREWYRTQMPASHTGQLLGVVHVYNKNINAKTLQFIT